MSISNVQLSLPFGAKLASVVDHLIHSSLVYQENQNHSLVSKTVVVITKSAMVPVAALAAVISTVEAIATSVFSKCLSHSDSKIKVQTHSILSFSVPSLLFASIFKRSTRLNNIHPSESLQLELIKANQIAATSNINDSEKRDLVTKQIIIGHLSNIIRKKENNVLISDSFERVKIEFYKVALYEVQTSSQTNIEFIFDEFLTKFKNRGRLKWKLENFSAERISFIINQLQTLYSPKNNRLRALNRIEKDILNDSNLYSDAHFQNWQSDKQNLLAIPGGQRVFERIQGDPQRHLITSIIINKQDSAQAVSHFNSNWIPGSIFELSAEQIDQLVSRNYPALADAAFPLIDDTASTALEAVITPLSSEYPQRFNQFTQRAFRVAYHQMAQFFSDHPFNAIQGRDHIRDVARTSSRIAQLTQYVELTCPLPENHDYRLNERMVNLNLTIQEFKQLTAGEKRLLINKIIQRDDFDQVLATVNPIRRVKILSIFNKIQILSQALLQNFNNPVLTNLKNRFDQEYQNLSATI